MSGRNVPQDVPEVLEHFLPLEQDLETVELVRDEVPTHFFVDDPDARYYAWCSHCQEFVNLDKSHHRKRITCPYCGEEGDIIHTWRGYKNLVDKVLMYVYSKSVKSPEDTITARAIYMEYRWGEKDRFGEMQLPWNREPYLIVDSYYVFTYGQGAVQVRPVNNWKMNALYPGGGIDQWTVSHGVNSRFGVYAGGEYGCNRYITLALSNDSIDDAVAETPFRYVWDEIRDTFLNAGNIGAYVRLFAYLAKYPFATETLAKLGVITQDWLYSITELGKTGGGLLNWRGKTIKKLFRYNLTKGEKAWLRQSTGARVGPYSLFAVWQKLRAMGNIQITLPIIDEVRITPYRMQQIQQIQGLISPDRLIKYIERQRQKHPDFTITIDLYTDYLSYCKRLNVDMREKAALLPRDLMEAHDNLIREFRQLQELQREEELRKEARRKKKEAKGRNQQYRRLRPAIIRKYTFEADGMMIYVPKRLEELVEEGVAMHSCVGGYVERVAAGKTIVVFIRSAEDPSERIGTMEISKDGLSIVQARAKYNKDLPPAAANFVKKFKAAKIDAINRDLEKETA